MQPVRCHAQLQMQGCAVRADRRIGRQKKADAFAIPASRCDHACHARRLSRRHVASGICSASQQKRPRSAKAAGPGSHASSWWPLAANPCIRSAALSAKSCQLVRRPQLCNSKPYGQRCMAAGAASRLTAASAAAVMPSAVACRSAALTTATMSSAENSRTSTHDGESNILAERASVARQPVVLVASYECLLDR